MGSAILFNDIHAQARQQTLIAEAEQARRHHLARAAAQLPIGTVRRSIGATLVRIGEIVQGPRYETQAA